MEKECRIALQGGAVRRDRREKKAKKGNKNTMEEKKIYQKGREI